MIVKRYDCPKCKHPVEVLDDGTEWIMVLDGSGCGVDWVEHDCWDLSAVAEMLARNIERLKAIKFGV